MTCGPESVFVGGTIVGEDGTCTTVNVNTRKRNENE